MKGGGFTRRSVGNKLTCRQRDVVLDLANKVSLEIVNRIGEYPVVELAVADVETKLAEEIRETYYRFYREITGRHEAGRQPVPKWDGGWDSKSSRQYRKNTWRELAKFFVARDIDPVEYVKVQMQFVTVSNVLHPNQLQSALAMERWTKYKTQVGDESHYKLQAQWHALDMTAHPLHTVLKWSVAEAAEFAVRDKRKVVSPVVRYVYATYHQLPHCAAEIESDAVVPYVFGQKLYDGSFGSLIPARMRTLAETYRRS